MNLTLSVPDELYKEMKKHPQFKWSEVARQAIKETVEDAELLDDLRSIRQGEKELTEGKGIPYKEILKRYG